MAKLKWSGVVVKTAIAASDYVMGLVGGVNARISFETLDQRYATSDEIEAAANGIKYFWDDIAARNAQVGMVADDQGMMRNTAQNRADVEVGFVYLYSGAAWVYNYTMAIEGAIIREGSKETKTAAYPITIADEKKIIELGFANAADRVFTLPSVGATEDGLEVTCVNNSMYVLTIQSSDSDFVWNSGAGYGVDLPDRGTSILLRYDHANTKWDIIQKTGGKVLIEGLSVYERFNRLTGRQPGTSALNLGLDQTEKHYGGSSGNPIIQITEANGKFPYGWAQLDGTGDNFEYTDSPDWDIFSNQTGHKTLSIWVYFNGLGSSEYIVCQYEDSDNRIQLYKNAANELALLYRAGATNHININGGSISAATWTNVTLVIFGADVGIYIDGVQVAYDATWSIDSFSGNLFIGQDGADANYMNGRIQDFQISYNNPYDAAPNVGVTDTFTVPAAPFQGVMN